MKSCGYNNKNIWCANAAVGAGNIPGACPRRENYKDNVIYSYEGFDSENCSPLGINFECNSTVGCGAAPQGLTTRTENNGNCTDINKKGKCQRSYEVAEDGTPTVVCDYKKRCKRTDQYCMNSTLCKTECPSSDDGGGGGTCDKSVRVFPSACDKNNNNYGCVVTSTDLYPWIGGSNNREGTNGVLYGFVAQYCGDDACNGSSIGCTTGMGAVYEITFSNGKTGFVQVINCGDIDNSTTVFDFLVPGGGMGTKKGCANMPGWKMSDYCSYDNDTKYCALYGGIFTDVDKGDVFPGDTDAQTALTDVLRNSDYFEQPTGNSNSGNATLKSVQYVDPSSPSDAGAEAITILSALSGIKQSTSSQYVSDFKDGNMMMTHYWDCCKPNVVSNPPSNGSGDCPLGYRTASIINSNGDGFASEGEGNSSCISNYNSNLYGGCCIYSGGVCTAEHGSNTYCGENATNCADCGKTDVNAYFDASGKLVSP
jgi:hypothetical protein